MNGSSCRGGDGQGRRFSILGSMKRGQRDPGIMGGDACSPRAGERSGTGSPRDGTRRGAGKTKQRSAHKGARHRKDYRAKKKGGRMQHPGAAKYRTVKRTAKQADVAVPDAFELFSAYHLGIGEDGRYRPTNIHAVARRFGTSVAGIKSLLVKYGMDSESIINSDFDMAMAQYDIQVAPDGINVRELAKGLFQEFLSASRNARDWRGELARDAEVNEEIFGKGN